MRILELCTYSAGGCGVFARVKRESVLLRKKGYEVMIFSSNFEKGTNNIVPLDDEVEGVKIKRFPARKLGGESYTYWDFTKEALKYKPDVIIAHAYRHTHTKKAIKIAKKLKCKVFLVTHAPFDRSNTRTLLEKIVVWTYDKFIGLNVLNKFNKVFVISKWEIAYLENIGLNKDRIVYTPNGIAEEFFTKKYGKENEHIISYTGRVAPIKNLEVVIKALAISKNKELKLEIFGPCETEYKDKLVHLIKKLNLQNKVAIFDKKYNSSEQIKQLDKSKIFILPSYSEGMPQSLIEAMARSKLIIASDIPACRDLIEDGKNGFFFKLNDEKFLAKLIDEIINLKEVKLKKIENNAIASVKQFSWKKIIDKFEKDIKR